MTISPDSSILATLDEPCTFAVRHIVLEHSLVAETPVGIVQLTVTLLLVVMVFADILSPNLPLKYSTTFFLSVLEASTIEAFGTAEQSLAVIQPVEECPFIAFWRVFDAEQSLYQLSLVK